MSPQSNIENLEKAYNQGSANRRGGNQFAPPPSNIPVSVHQAPRSNTPNPRPSDNGSYRQPQNIPTSIPSNLPRGLATGLDHKPIPAPRITKQYSSNNLPNPTIPLRNRLDNIGQRAGNLGNRINNGAGAASLALSVGSSGVQAARTRSVRDIANAGLDVVSAGLLIAPHPVAKGAGLLLQLGKIVFNMFPSNENVTVTPEVAEVSAPFTGGQIAGVVYKLNYEYQGNDSRFNGFWWGVINFRVYGPISGIEPKIDGKIHITCCGVVGNHNYNPIPITVKANIQAHFDGGLPIPQIRNISIVREDGLPDSSDNLPPITEGVQSSSESNSNQDGYAPPNYDDLRDKLDNLTNLTSSNADALNDLRNNLSPDALREALRNALPQNNNGVTPVASNRVPLAVPIGDTNLLTRPSPSPNYAPNRSTNRSQIPATQISATQIPATQIPATQIPAANVENRLNKTPVPSTVPKPEPSRTSTSLSQSLNDRFKDPKDCKFSCSALAECFTDLVVRVFDGCNENGTAKTKDITIQVLPKDRNKTLESFKQLLDIRSKECSLNEKVLTVPEYWQARVGQRPQAVILYREFVNGKFGAGYYSLHIPHYNGNKNTKPRLTQYDKGEHSAIYVCKDNSKLTVFAGSEQEAKRMINELEKYINPRLRGETVKIGIRKGINKTTVKPIRLDFFSTGQTKLSPDWSIAL